MGESLFYGADLAELQTWAGWPKDPSVIVIPGGAGHDREITVTFGSNYEAWGDNRIPDFLEGAVRALLPESWRIDNRGSRLELHPSGRFAGGFDKFDVAAVMSVMHDLGFDPEIPDWA